MATKRKGINLVPKKTIHAVIQEDIGRARQVGNFVAQSPEWHELRETGVGGSEVAAIVGCSPWKSAFTLWAERTKKIEREKVENDSVEWGVRLEPVILEKFADNHPEFKIHSDLGSWANIDRPWQISNPDGIFETEAGEKGIIEVKTAAYEDDWKEYNGREWHYAVPVYYRTQVQWYLQTFGFKRAFLVVLFAGRKYVEIELEADEFEQDTNLKAVERFREHVAKDQKPEWDGSSSTLETVRKMHPLIDDTEVELGDLGVHYANAVAEHEQSEKRVNELKARVLDAMGKAKRGLIEDVWTYSRTSRAGGTPYLATKRN
jgi:putative phage-type endonuclease